MKKGKVILLFGISGAGKTYYKNILTEKFDLYQLNRITTRNKRGVEEGKRETYITKNMFLKKIINRELYIYAKINNSYYGYSKKEIKKYEEGINVIGDCYYKLLKKLRRKLKKNLIAICIQPINLEYTLDLIKKERTDSKERIIDAIKEYQYFIDNKKYIDYFINTNYDKNTENQVIDLVLRILNKENEIRRKEENVY